MIRFLLLVCLWLPSSVFAEEGAKQWHMRDADSFIKFAVAIEGSPSEGEFTKFTADIVFDPQKLAHSRVEITIDLNHIEAFYSDVEKNLKKKQWFDVAHYPTARYVSRHFKHLGGNDYQVTGDLTLRDVTQSETFYFTLTEYDEHQAAIKGRMKLNRLDYGVGQGGWRSVTSVAGLVFLDVVVRAVRK